MAARPILALLIGAVLWSAQAPPGTRIWVRLLDPVSTASSHTGDRVRAAVIAPGGPILTGTVAAVSPPAPDQRAKLEIRFACGRLVTVDNARESIDEHGAIHGILASETLAGRMDSGLQRLGERYAGLAGVLGAIKESVLPSPDTAISYAPGVELELELTAPLELPAPSPQRATGYARTAAAQPFRTVSATTHRSSDLVNVIIVGSQAALIRAFHEAGWTEAQPLNSASKFETLRALAADRGYSEAPVSVLLLNAKPPRLVLEKLNDTFAQRHHLRAWHSGSHLWAIAATHDTGIDVSQEDHTFIHRIDPNIDREREKVVNDLLFTGRVARWELVERPNVPRETQNATGDEIHSDGKTAVVILR